MFPAAKVGDQVLGSCTHVYASTTPGPPVGNPVPTPVTLVLPFVGKIVSFDPSVMIGGMPAVTAPAQVVNTAIHSPVGGGSIPGPAAPVTTNVATITEGSSNVLVGGKPLVRTGNKVQMPACGLTAPATVVGTAANVMVP